MFTVLMTNMLIIYLLGEMTYKKNTQLWVQIKNKFHRVIFFNLNSLFISSSTIFANDRFSFVASFFNSSSAFSESRNDVTFLLIIFAFASQMYYICNTI